MFKSFSEIADEITKPHQELIDNIERYLKEKDGMGLISFLGNTYKPLTVRLEQTEYYIKVTPKTWGSIVQVALDQMIRDLTDNKYRLQWDYSSQTDGIITIGWERRHGH